MASCSLATLQAQACANGFLDLDKKSARAIELQLVKTISGDTSTLAHLLAKACANGFLNVNENDFRAIQETFLFNLAACESPPEPVCVNLIPDGSVYSGSSFILINTIGPSILQENTTYQITFGANETLLASQGGIPPTLYAPGTYTFTTGTVDSGGRLSLLTNVTGSLVTATICEV
jgi:hypothetical protein